MADMAFTTTGLPITLKSKIEFENFSDNPLAETNIEFFIDATCLNF